jgi:hypothetical protein
MSWPERQVSGKHESSSGGDKAGIGFAMGVSPVGRQNFRRSPPSSARSVHWTLHIEDDAGSWCDDGPTPKSQYLGGKRNYVELPFFFHRDSTPRQSANSMIGQQFHVISTTSGFHSIAAARVCNGLVSASESRPRELSSRQTKGEARGS